MVDLYGTPFVELVDRMRLEFERQQSIFDLPQRKWHLPPAVEGIDLSVRFHGQLAGNPVGPASGPQTQMAQNLVLSWLAGARIMELKTVQVNDELNISRPCIDAANVGYNVEWSQELRVADSLDQYVQGAMLIHMLRHAPAVFGHPFDDVPMDGTSGETIYDIRRSPCAGRSCARPVALRRAPRARAGRAARSGRRRRCARSRARASRCPARTRRRSCRRGSRQWTSAALSRRERFR